MKEFFVLEDICLNKFVSHVSITGFGCLVSCCDDKLSAILFDIGLAVKIREFLQEHKSECYGYRIVPFK